MDAISSSFILPYLAPAQNDRVAGARASNPEEKTTTDSHSQKPAKENGGTLSAAEQASIRALKSRDQEVRQHEQAHLSAAGSLARSAAGFTMQTGPDGKRYAIGGEVQIDVSPGQTPEETLIKARIILAAALAPAEPSGPDRNIATRARAMEMQAHAEIAQRSKEAQKLASQYQAGADDLPRSTMETEA